MIIPAAGSATRMRGFPKFLLPCDVDNTTLIERHIENLSEFFDEILIGVNPDFYKLISSVVQETDQIRILELSTKTMMETVSKLAGRSRNENFVLIMPDTYFSDYSEIKQFFANAQASRTSLACWKLQDFQLGKLGQVLINQDSFITDIQDKNPNCKYEEFWGMATFTRNNLLNAVESDSHIGMMFERLLQGNIPVNALTISGRYYDCGTPQEYITMLSQINSD